MTRICGQHLIVVAAILHLVTDAAFASSAVLCVGSGGHIAVEAQHAGVGSHARASGPGPPSFAGLVPSGCLDAQLHPDCAEMTSARIDGSEIGAQRTSLSRAIVRPPGADPSSLALARRADVFARAARGHRTIVLLL